MAAPPADAKDDDGVAIRAIIPSLETDNPTLNEAFRIAIGDLLGNVSPGRRSANLFGLPSRTPLILAGLHYDTPWTRDAAINAWNGASLIMPEVSRNTLCSVIETECVSGESESAASIGTP